jgi:hypothetical protein
VPLEAADFRVNGGEGIGIDELIDHRRNEITIEGAGGGEIKRERTRGRCRRGRDA